MITREMSGARMSKIVEYQNVIYFSGIVPSDKNLDVKGQTLDVLNIAHALFEKAGTSKKYLLKAEIFLKDIDEDFAAFNEVWDAWVDTNNPPARACVEGRMSTPQTLVEIVFTAVKTQTNLTNFP